MDVLGSMVWSGVSLARSVELTIQWECFFWAGPVCPVTLSDLQLVRRGGIGEFCGVTGDLRCWITNFAHRVVVRRRDVAIRAWRN